MNKSANANATDTSADQVTRLLDEAASGRQQAMQELFPLVYGDVCIVEDSLGYAFLRDLAVEAQINRPCRVDEGGEIAIEVGDKSVFLSHVVGMPAGMMIRNRRAAPRRAAEVLSQCRGPHLMISAGLLPVDQVVFT